MGLPKIQLTGYIYFVTIVVQNRIKLFTTASYVIPLLDSFNFYRYKHPFKLLGYVIMPDHIHWLMWPAETVKLGDVMRDFKKFTAVRLIRQAEIEQNEGYVQAFQRAGQKSGHSFNKVWQDDYWDKLVYSERFLREKLHYMHRNPVRARLVVEPQEYPYSSYRNYVSDDDSFIKIDKDWLL
ncbi:MAG: transposase [Chloroflexota bacterium]